VNRLCYKEIIGDTKEHQQEKHTTGFEVKENTNQEKEKGF